MTATLLQSLLVIVTAATAVAVQNIQLRRQLPRVLQVLHLKVLRQQVRMRILLVVLCLLHQNLWMTTVMRYAHSSLYCFTFYLFLGTSLAVIASSISGAVLLLAILVVTLVLNYVKLRNKTSTSRDDPQGNLETSLKKLPAAPRENAHTSTDSGLTQCEENSAADSEQCEENSVTDSEHLEPNSREINERDETTVAIVSFFLSCLQQIFKKATIA